MTSQEAMRSDCKISFHLLFSALRGQLDKDRAKQLSTLYTKLEKSEVSKDDVLKYMKSIAGEEMLTSTIGKLKTQAASQSQSQSQSQPQPSGMQLEVPAGNPVPLQNQGQWPSSTIKEHQTVISPSVTHVKQKPPPNQSNSQQRSQLSRLPPAPSKPGSAASGIVKDGSLEIHSSRAALTPPTTPVPASSVSSSPGMIKTDMLPNAQYPYQKPHVARPKKPLVGQKKLVKAPGSSPPARTKKQKVSGSFDDRSTEQLNDVIAVSGISLQQEEGEQLLSMAKKDSQMSEASRQTVREEEERMILQKIPLQKLMGEIIERCGLKNMSDDVQRCLSVFVEERMRRLILNAIRLSKQRVEMEKPRHETVTTSNILQQVMRLNREERDKRQAEAEKLQKLNDPGRSTGVNADKEKNESRGKPTKVNKEEDDKMRATAANIAVRAATGVGDFVSRWQFMIEAKQKTGASNTSSDSHTRGNQDWDENKPLLMRKVGRNEAVERSISVKDVIAVLEREPQMSKSTLLYRLYLR